MGQTVWYQDFPKKQQKSGGQQPASPFEETLTQFLAALKVQPTPQSILPPEVSIDHDAASHTWLSSLRRRATSGRRRVPAGVRLQ